MPMFDYGKALNRSWVAGTWQVLLLKGTWVPNITLEYVSQVAPSEAAGTNYSRKNLAGQSITVDTVNHRADHYADSVTWTTLTCSDFRYAAVYLFGTSDADSVLHSYYDLSQRNVTNTTVIVDWNGSPANGIVFRGA